MLRRIRPRLVADLARRDLPRPLDVVNLIELERLESYRWYGVLVMPAMAAVGGRLRLMARLDREVVGERQAEKLLVVRYPSHRRFLAMTLNPYYLAINRLRETGVRRFEASFTHASQPGDGLMRHRVLIGAHFNSPAGTSALGEVAAGLREAGGELVYATRAVASLGILQPPAETDPNPMRLGEVALFAPATDEVDDRALARAAAALDGSVDGLAVHVYRRESPRAYRPALLGGTA